MNVAGDEHRRNAGPERGDADDRRSAWAPFLVRLIIALIVLTPFVAILIQALGKR